MIKKILSKIIQWLVGETKPEQRTFVYCSCGNEMCSNGSFVSDTYEKDGNHVRYKCKACKEESDWDFDIAPVAIKRPFATKNRHEEAAEKDPETQIICLKTGKILKGYGERITHVGNRS